MKSLRKKGIDHPLVQQLAGGRPDESVGGDGSPTAFPPDSELQGGKLDDLLSLADQHAVLKADFSQLQAIEAARGGRNLVVHGPPGTGKSQTITNIIATLIADGKRVLFVSEKRAALDVVKRNLEACDLGILCLDLHSEYGRKSAVYDQIRNAVESERAITPIRKDRLHELGDIRDKLNAAVRAVHKPRGAIGYSLYRMAGRYAKVQGLPAADLVVPSMSALTPELYSKIRQACARLARHAREFTFGRNSPWVGLRATDYEVGLADRLREESGAIDELVLAFQAASGRVAGELGVSLPTTLEQAMELQKLCIHLTRSPGVPSHWLSSPVLGRLEPDASAAKALCESWVNLSDQVRSLFEQGTKECSDAGGELANLNAVRGDSEALRRLLGPDWGQACVVRTEVLVPACESLSNGLERLVSLGERLKHLIPGVQLDSWQDVDNTLNQVKTVLRLSPIPTHWVTATEQAAKMCREYEALARDLGEKQTVLFDTFDESIVDRVDDVLALRFRVDYQGVFRSLRPRYWKDMRLIRGHLNMPRRLPFVEAHDWIGRIQRVQKARSLWREKEPHGEEAFGHRFDGLRTNWTSLGEDIEACKSICRKWLADPRVLRDLLSGQGDVRIAQQLFDSLSETKSEIEEEMVEKVGTRPETDLLVGQLHGVIEKAGTQLRAVAEASSALAPGSGSGSLSELIEAYEARQRFDGVDEELGKRSVGWSAQFGARFSGIGTDWEAVFRAITWTLALTEYVPKDVPDSVIRQAVSPNNEELTQWVDQLSEQFTEKLSQLFDEELTRWAAWGLAEWPDLSKWLRFVQTNPAQASDQIDYRKACAELGRLLGGDGNPVLALRDKTEDASMIPGMVDRQIVGAWINSANKEDPSLADFTGSEQRSLRDRFRELDQRFPTAVRQEVLRSGFERYPHASSLDADTGQVGLLTKELAKKRRQLPVRKLLAELPTLIGRLKPCMLMSPLAVSRFLPLTNDYFDAAIFDEASQVFPEDAVPSIVRAAKVIVVGDRKQLPPTNFFRRADDEESLDEDDATDEGDRFIGTESILDAIVGLVGQGQVGEQYLRVHYR